MIYLDQFVYSEIAKARQNSVRSSSQSAGRGVDPFWRDADAQLSRLALLQLAAFPKSSFHFLETAVARDRKEIERVYEGLSRGIHFLDSDAVQRRQLYDAAREWASDDGSHEVVGLEPEGVLRGSLTGWQDIWTLTISPGEPFANQLREEREFNAKVLRKVLASNAREPRSFKEIYLSEARSYGPAVLKAMKKEGEKQRRILMGLQDSNPGDLLPASSFLLYREVKKALEDTGVAESELTTRTIEFFQADYLTSVPFVRLETLLWAALIRKVASGQKRVPAGESNDVKMISTLLPYCDAMFVDRAWHGLLTENPVPSHWKAYETRLFSKRNGPEFLAYLSEIEESCPPEHMDLAREVFGVS